MTKREMLHEFAEECIGKDMAPRYNVLGCAEAVNNIANLSIGRSIGGDVSTYRMYAALERGTYPWGFWRFVKVPREKALPGDIIISPTGHRRARSTIRNGHVGILADNRRVMSNNSHTGLWDEHHTVDSWYDYYWDKGKYPVFFYRVIR